MNQNRRKFKNYLLNARLSRRYHVYAFLLTLVFLSVFQFYGLGKLHEIESHLAQLPELSAGTLAPVFTALSSAESLFITGLLTYSIFTLLFLIFLEQKVGGATVAILTAIEEMRKGNFDYKRNLRDGDELKSIMDALQAMAKDLKDNSK